MVLHSQRTIHKRHEPSQSISIWTPLGFELDELDSRAPTAVPVACRLGPLTPVPAWRPKLKVEPRNRRSGQVLSFLEAEDVQALQKQNDMDIHTLLQALVPIAAEIALPYISGFFVGCGNSSWLSKNTISLS